MMGYHNTSMLGKLILSHKIVLIGTGVLCVMSAWCEISP